jgi:hypothetical protein
MTSYRVAAYPCKHAISSLKQIYVVLIVAMAGLAGLPGLFWPVLQTSFPPRGGSVFLRGAGGQTRQTRKPGAAGLVPVGGTRSLECQPA